MLSLVPYAGADAVAITEWSGNIFIVELNDEPMFSEEMDSLMVRLGPIDSEPGNPRNPRNPRSQQGDIEDLPDVILDMKGVSHVNSSNLAQLLKLRKRLHLAKRRLRICAVNDRVWTVLLITGLDGLFEFTEDVSTSLASLQIED